MPDELIPLLVAPWWIAGPTANSSRCCNLLLAPRWVQRRLHDSDPQWLRAVGAVMLFAFVFNIAVVDSSHG